MPPPKGYGSCKMFEIIPTKFTCHNLSLRFATKARVCKGAGQGCNPKVAFHVLGNVGKCEGMNSHTPK